MSLARLWKDFDVDRDTTVFHPVPCRSVPSVLSKGFSTQEFKAELARDPAKAIIFWQTAKGPEDTAYFILPKRVIAQAEESGSWRVTHSVDPNKGAYYALSPRPGGEGQPDRFKSDGALIFLPDGCDMVARGLVGDAEHAFYTFARGSVDFPGLTTNAVRAVVAHTRGEAYRRLRLLLQGDNETFARNLPRLGEYVPVELKNMRGLPQLPGHYGLDPVEHTLRALEESTKSATLMKRHFEGRWEVCREWVRCALIYHDLGKKVNPFNVKHAKLSGKMSRFHLRCMGYAGHVEEIIARLVETHDVLGGIKRGRLTVNEGVKLLCRGMGTIVPLDRLVDMHYEVALADIHSIGYLRHVSLRDEYLAMRRAAPVLGRAPRL